MLHKVIARLTLQRQEAGTALPDGPPTGADGSSDLTDPVSLSVKAGLQARRRDARPEARLLAHAAGVVQAARTDGDPHTALDEVLGLVEDYPSSERLQVLAARVAELALGKSAARTIWKGVHQRFPSSIEAFRLMLRWTGRELGREAVLRNISSRYPDRPDDLQGLLLYAAGYDELKIFDKADAAFEALMEAYPEHESVYLQFADVLGKRGEIARAAQVLQTGAVALGPTPKLTKNLKKVSADLRELRVLAPSAKETQASNAVLSEIFAELLTRRRVDEEYRSFVGPVMMVIGSLGSGGAERQFTITAKALQSAVMSGEQIAGYDVIGPVHVCCRSSRSRPGADFFQAELRDMGIAVHQYADFEPFGGCERSSVTSEFRSMLRFLPREMTDGLIKLADSIRLQAPDIVHIWQDGSILTTGMAALMAGVPRIVLNVRSMPPIDRPDKYKPEYEMVYRSLLASPGVRLTANSRVAARRYSEWLGIDPDAVSVIYNGVDPLPDTAGSDEMELARHFDLASRGADFTVGGVMRFDENKRPFLWLEAAASVMRSAPEARFILVGDGPLKEPAEAYAKRLGIGDRLLFVGRSHRVGYWLRHMDAFVLLSHVEGLPNVLVEAQRAGVPVVTTPAGGAPETLMDKQTGFLLPSAESPDPQEIASCLLALRNNPSRRATMGLQARQWAEATFSTSSMMERTVRAFMD